MDTKEFGLEDATALAKDGDLFDPRLRRYVSDLDDAATNALRDKDREWLTGALAMVTSMGLAELTVDSDGDPDLDGMVAALRLSESKSFRKVMASAFKMAVGLTIKEGLK